MVSWEAEAGAQPPRDFSHHNPGETSDVQIYCAIGSDCKYVGLLDTSEGQYAWSCARVPLKLVSIPLMYFGAVNKNLVSQTIHM